MINFKDLLEASDFRQAVNDLAADLRARFSLPPVHQLGLVVPDVEAAAGELEARGLGPFFIASGAPVLWRERGEERKFRGQLGIAYHRGFELELLAPGEGSDFYRSWLDPGGAIVVQHLGLLVDDVDAWAEKLTAAGYPVEVRGRIQSGPLRTEFAYMDTAGDAGLVIEFIDWRFFGRRMSPPPWLMRGLGRMEMLIGKRSLSL